MGMAMKGRWQQHNMEKEFVFVIFAVFTIFVMMALALGTNQYQTLVNRDNELYNKQIITSYVAAKIRSFDESEGVEAGGFSKGRREDDIETLHLYQKIDGERYEIRIYYYEGYIRELFTEVESSLTPDAGNKIVEAKELSLKQRGKMIEIDAVDGDGFRNTSTVYLRNE
jgi:hypothetical protein